MRIIGISGKAGHGKDTVGNFLRAELEALGKSVLTTHYADLLKYICTNFFGWDGNKDEEGRSLLQWVGTEIKRAQHTDYVANFICDILSTFPNRWDYVLIPDVRFPNEIEVPISRGFDFIHLRVTRPNFNSGLTPEQLTHQTEVALDTAVPDVVISNTADLATLRAQVIALARLLESHDPLAEQCSLVAECYT